MFYGSVPLHTQKRKEYCYYRHTDVLNKHNEDTEMWCALFDEKNMNTFKINFDKQGFSAQHCLSSYPSFLSGHQR